jgi:putative chitinase
MITADTIKAFAPKAWPDYVDALVAGKAEIEGGGINTPLIWCHFISQLAHESRGLSLVREDTTWTGARMKALWPKRFPLGAADPRIALCRGDAQKLANLAYGSINGNQGGDDGWDYRGGGLIQLTGRANYRACGQSIGIDLEHDPGVIEDPAVAIKAVLWFWTRNDLTRFARHNYGRAVGNGINRGNPYSAQEPIGFKDREQWFRRAWAMWGEGALPDEAVLCLGAHGPQVQQVQIRLKELGYAVGAVDAVLGPATARALAGFKLDRRRAGADLEPDEGVGPLTLAALGSADRAPLSPERTEATVASLSAAGSTGVATGQRAKATGQAGLYLGAAAGAAQLGLLDTVNSWLSGINVFHMAAVPAIDAAKWALNNWLWVGVMIGGVWMYVRGGEVIVARLRAHRDGSNLGR